MSAGGAFGGARGLAPKPPEKGVFPLDHFGECKQVKEEYLACLKEHGSEAEACTDVARKYLQCRMNKNLMAEQSLDELGFPEQQPGQAQQQQQPKQEKRRFEAEGFVAGTRRFEKQ